MSALELALLVLKVVRDFEAGADYDEDALPDTNGIIHVTYFFSSFTTDVVKTKSNDFMFMMADRVWNMMHDDDLSKDNLRNVFKENLDSGK